MKLSEVKKKVQEEGLVYVNDRSAGWFRQKSRNVFTYYNTRGEKIKDEEKLERIKSLGIPPAWDEVWISPKKNGHIQATGLDERGKKQYIYHPEWIKAGQENKFSRMVDFGLSLPSIRGKVRYNIKESDMDRERIIATIIWLLEKTFIRIGNEEYSKENDSFGLTTLRNKHISIKSGEATISFKGKHNIPNTLQIDNPTIVKTLKKCVELPGYQLFQYVDEKGERHVVDSKDVNDFLKDVTKKDFTAKDFRTWGGSSISSSNLFRLGHSDDVKIIKKNITDTIKKVAEHLNNTVAVCKSYYIHPTVFDTYQRSILVPHFAYYKKSGSKQDGLNWNEYALVKLLKKYNKN